MKKFPVIYILFCMAFKSTILLSQKRELHKIYRENRIVLKDYSLCNSFRYLDENYVIAVDADSIIDLIVAGMKEHNVLLKRAVGGKNWCQSDLINTKLHNRGRPKKWWKSIEANDDVVLVPFIRINTDVVTDKLFRLENKELIYQYFKSTSFTIEFVFVKNNKRIYRNRVYSDQYFAIDEQLYSTSLEYFSSDAWKSAVFRLITFPVYE